MELLFVVVVVVVVVIVVVVDLRVSDDLLKLFSARHRKQGHRACMRDRIGA